ncbi:hypothetical protein [Spirosoma agri]|uniref:Uncharacterized protein n=1 Tax=Spirosoma agri TaxID=1987381 RepID=A0A6M0ID59_9BACT|nr:hypothetical protein [Spirosoma agri]NEU65757.1 hypothetical protein [Spirosoma agri]
MKRIVFSTTVLWVGLLVSASAQSNQAPTMQQTTSTEDNRRANLPKPMLKKMSGQEQRKLEKGMDTTLPKNRPNPNRKQRRLRPDSLRRGGATRVDTI